MDNFFGIGTNSSFYDKRRHINLIYQEFVHFKLLVHDNRSLAMQVKQVLATDLNTRFNAFQSMFLNNYENNFLYYLKQRYQMPDDDYTRIIAGESFKNPEFKSPAGYNQEQDWRLVIQMIYATILTGHELQPYTQHMIESFIYPFAQGMGIGVQPSSPRIIGESIQSCLNKGMRSFEDLPAIEDFTLSRLGFK